MSAPSLHVCSWLRSPKAPHRRRFSARGKHPSIAGAPWGTAYTDYRDMNNGKPFNVSVHQCRLPSLDVQGDMSYANVS